MIKCIRGIYNGELIVGVSSVPHSHGETPEFLCTTPSGKKYNLDRVEIYNYEELPISENTAIRNLQNE